MSGATIGITAVVYVGNTNGEGKESWKRYNKAIITGAPLCLKILTLFGLFPKLGGSGDDGVDGGIVLMIQLTSTAVEKIIIMPYIYM